MCKPSKLRIAKSPVIMLACIALLLPGFSVAKEKNFSLPRAYHAKTYPANDVHEDEKLTIAADPYDTSDKARTVFSARYTELGIIPIHLILSNDGNGSVSVGGMKVVLITKKRTQIEPDTSADLYRHIARVPDPMGQTSKIPLPIPRKNKGPISREALDEINTAQFMVRAVEPHTTHAGFLFFNVSGIENPLAGATLEISGIINSQGQELFYFTIPMEKYLSYQPTK